MYQSLDKLENSKFDGEPVPPPLNLLLPRLIPKEPPIKLASNSYPRVNSFISRKRNKSKAKEESKSKKNIFNSQNNTQYDNYFIDKLQENITNFKKYLYNTSSKCFICGKPGHHSTECKEKEDEICPKCLQKNHFNQICPNEICVNCGKRGHNQQNCFYTSGNKNKKNLKKCKNCHNYGHESFECLCKPNPIHIKNYSKIPLCVFCGNPNHYICPFNKNKNIFIIPDHYDDSGNNLNLYEYNSNKIINRNSWESLLNFFNNQCKITGKIELNLGEVSDNLLKEDIQDTYVANRITNTTDDPKGMLWTGVLAIPSWYAIATLMDKYAQKCRGDYEKTIPGKIGAFGDKVTDTVKNSTFGKSSFASSLNNL